MREVAVHGLDLRVVGAPLLQLAARAHAIGREPGEFAAQLRRERRIAAAEFGGGDRAGKNFAHDREVHGRALGDAGVVAVGADEGVFGRGAHGRDQFARAVARGREPVGVKFGRALHHRATGRRAAGNTAGCARASFWRRRPRPRNFAGLDEPGHGGEVRGDVDRAEVGGRFAGGEGVLVEREMFAPDAAEHHRGETAVAERQRIGPFLGGPVIPGGERAGSFGRRDRTERRKKGDGEAERVSRRCAGAATAAI